MGNQWKRVKDKVRTDRRRSWTRTRTYPCTDIPVHGHTVAAPPRPRVAARRFRLPRFSLCRVAVRLTPGVPAPSGHRSVARAMAGLLLLVVAAVPVLPAPAQAAIQVSNLGQGTSTTLMESGWDPEAQGFRTGTHPSGYSLTSVQIHIDSFVTATIADMTIKLRPGSQYNADVLTFSNPTFTSAGTLTFTLPAGTTFDLTSETWYFVIIDINNTVTTGGVNLGTTTATDEDSGAAAGWEIFNDSHWNDLGVWTGNGYMYRIAVDASLKNTPATGLPTITGTATAVDDVLTAVTTGISDVDGLSSVSYGYQWIQVDDMAVETDISGETSSTYTLVAATVGKHFKVRVTFQDDRSFDESLTSKLHPARTGGICARTEQVRNAIVVATAATTCANVTATHLSGLGLLNLRNQSISSLQSGDFAGLTGLRQLNLSNNALSSLPANIFAGLTALDQLELSDNGLTELPRGIFDRLTALTFLRLENNDLSSLPARIFDRLTALTFLNLCDNTLTVLDLPPGILNEGVVQCSPTPIRVRRVTSGASASSVPTTPGEPQNLSGVPGDGQMTLTWDAPSSDGGSAITGYQYEIDDSGTWIDADLDLEQTVTLEETVTGLTNGQEYAVAVRAVTASGPGPAATVTATPVTTPGVPQNLRWVPGDGQVTLTWEAPSSNGGSAVTRYEYEIDDSGTWLDVGLDRQVTVIGLDNGRQYTVAVRAVNAIGDGDEATATVTLGQSGPLLRAWLSRFGRTVATHVTDTVGERLRDTAAPSSHVTVGGYRLPLGTRGADPAEPGVAPRSPGKKQRPEATEAGALRLSMGMESGSAVEPKGTRLGSGDVGLDPWADRPGQDPRVGQTQALRLRDLLMGSSFRLMLGGDDARPGAMRLTAWGRMAGTQFNGRDRAVALAGDVITGTLGVDSEWERWLAGVAVSHSRGDGSYRIAGTGGAGEVENVLTSLHPYLRYAVNERLDVWGVLGYGWGDVTLKPGPGVSLETGTTLVMGAFGGRGILLPATELGGFELATRTDAMLTRMTSDADAVLDATDADAHLLRVVLEGSREVTWPEGQSVTPSMEIGLRHDWGDAETGFGLELGGRVQYADPTLGLTIEAAVRGLLAHEDSDYGEWGASGLVRLAPGPDGQGLAVTLAPAWGAASSGAATPQTPAFPPLSNLGGCVA